MNCLMRSIYILFVFSILIPVSAFAARMESINTVYFDANNYPVGQHAESCANVHWEGGQQSGLYSLQVISGCGDSIFECGYNWHGSIQGGNLSQTFDCEGNGSYWSSTSRLLGDWRGTNLEDACDTTGVCALNPPELLNGWGFSVYQTYP